MSFRLSSASLHLDRQCWDLTRLIAEGVAGKLKSFSVNIQCFQLSLAISPIIKKKKKNETKTNKNNVLIPKIFLVKTYPVHRRVL